MAGTSKKCFTMQGLGSPVSAAGQGEKAGPQASSSSDCSSTVVGNLATVRYSATRQRSAGSAGKPPEQNESYHNCKNASCFCYICSKYEVPKNRRNINDNIKNLYKNSFNMNISNQDDNWVPKIVCNTCDKMLKSKTRQKIKVPCIWRKPLNHEDCYFCMTDIRTLNSKKKLSHLYAEVSSLTKPIFFDPHDGENNESLDTSHSSVEEKITGFIGDSSMQVDSDEDRETENYNEERSESDEDYRPYDTPEKTEQITANQKDVNDLVRNLGLPKDGSEYLASWLKNRNFTSDVKSSFYRDREKEFIKYFAHQEDISLVYCTDVKGLINELKPDCYRSDEWRLFIDSSNKSLKAVLLHNTNKYASIPVAYSRVTKEEYRKLDKILKKIKYSDHNWQICGDLKIITILLGQQSGFTKMPCFLCEWDSRDRANHYIKKNWPKRQSLKPGEKNVLHKPLVDSSKVLLPPLHIKLGLVKQYIKALNKDGDCFQYIAEMFPKVSEAKMKEGILDGPQIRKMLRNNVLLTKMNNKEKKAWLSFKNVVENFLGNNKSPNYKQIVAEMVKDFKNIGCLMNLKLHFLDSHVDYFPPNLGDYSEEQGERFHQDIKEMERRYQGSWGINMMADYCWSLKRDVAQGSEKHKRQTLHRSFENKRARYHSKKD